MQLVGEGRQDKVDVTYAAGELQLHRLMSGAFQFGIGKDAKIVTELSQVALFGPTIQGEVAQWLTAHGPRKAMQEKVDADIHEQAQSEPGSLDARAALLEKVVPGLKGEMQAFLDSILVKHGLVAPAADSPTAPQSAGRYRQATSDELRAMQKAGLPMDPNNPPRMFDPEGALVGPAVDLKDAPDRTIDPDTLRMPSAEDLLRDEADALRTADELAEDAEVLT